MIPALPPATHPSASHIPMTRAFAPRLAAATGATARADLSVAVRRQWRIATLAGAASAIGAVLWCYVNAHVDWAWAVVAFGIGVVVYSLVFYLLCSMRAPAMANFVAEDDVTIEAGDVVQTTSYDETGDNGLDFYIRAFAAARGVTMVTASSAILIGAALLFF